MCKHFSAWLACRAGASSRVLLCVLRMLHACHGLLTHTMSSNPTRTQLLCICTLHTHNVGHSSTTTLRPWPQVRHSLSQQPAGEPYRAALFPGLCGAAAAAPGLFFLLNGSFLRTGQHLGGLLSACKQRRGRGGAWWGARCHGGHWGGAACWGQCCSAAQASPPPASQGGKGPWGKPGRRRRAKGAGTPAQPCVLSTRTVQVEAWVWRAHDHSCTLQLVHAGTALPKAGNCKSHAFC